MNTAVQPKLDRDDQPQRELTSPPPTPPAPRRLEDLPMPPGVPVLGNLPQIKTETFHLTLEAWRRELGDAFRINMAGRKILVVADPVAIAAALRERPEKLGRTDRLRAVTAELGFEGVFSANGQTWRRQRPMVMAGFDPGHIRQFFPSLVKVTERFRGRWNKAADASQPIDLQADLMRFTVDVVAGLAFGADVNTLEQEQDVIQNHLDQILPSIFKRVLAPFPYWRYVKLPKDRQLDRHLAALAEAVAGFIGEARRELDAHPELRAAPKNLIQAMLVAREAPDSQLGDADLSSNVLTMLLAGEDTTANTLAWMIYLLSRNPQALATARDEVRRVLGEERVPSRVEQLQALDFVEACAHETMRLKPVAPILPQQVYQDTTIAGIDVPAGTSVIFLMRPGATDERHFAQPQRFDPARWISGGAADAGSAKRIAMPFGAGPRICPGRYLALLEMKMAMAMILRNFEIVSVDTPDGGEAREHLAMTMSPVGLRLRIATSS